MSKAARSIKKPVHPTASPSFPSADSTPLERVIVDGSAKLISMEGVPPIKRSVHTPADRNRAAFLARCVTGMGADVALHTYAASAWSMWGKLWPAAMSGYPVSYTRTAPSGSVAASKDDLVQALAILMRAGFLVTDTTDVLGNVARSDLRASTKGRHFILGEEGDGAKIYWPGNDASGVTLEPGYDMGSRDIKTVKADLVSIGVSDMVAAATSTAAAATGKGAHTFVKTYPDVITLTSSQQISLFNIVVPKYESLVARFLPVSLRPRLFQHEFDALLSLAWNTARFGHYGCNRSVALLDFVTAPMEWRTLTAGGPGIVSRRRRETDMFTNACYDFKSMGKPGICG